MEMTPDENEIENEMPACICHQKTEYCQAYFGASSNYYLPVMIDFERGNKFSFNVWAFFCGMFWLLYRKLYIAVLLFVITALLKSLIEKWAISYWGLNGEINNLIHLITTLILGIIFGYTGNYFLMRKAQDQIAQVLAAETDEDLILDKLKKAGSGNTLGVTLVLVFVVGFYVYAAVHGKIWG